MVNAYGAIMLEYGFRTLDGSTKSIQIKLLDNFFVRAWKEYLKNITSKVTLTWHLVQCANNKHYKTDAQVKEYLEFIKSAYLLFNENNIGNYTIEIETINKLLEYPSEVNQSNLNVWHRHFTALELKHSRNGYQTSASLDPQLLREAIQNINRCSHLLEGATYYKCPRRMAIHDSQQFAIQFTNANHESNSGVWSFLEQIPQGMFDWRCDDSNHTVWLNEDILGKDQMKAWLDHDDLTQFDVTGNLVMTPSIMLDPNRLYHKVLNNTEFREESMRSGKTVDRLPIGDIVETDMDYQTILGGKVTYMKLDNEIIWEENESLL